MYVCFVVYVGCVVFGYSVCVCVSSNLVCMCMYVCVCSSTMIHCNPLCYICVATIHVTMFLLRLWKSISLLVVLYYFSSSLSLQHDFHDNFSFLFSFLLRLYFFLLFIFLFFFYSFSSIKIFTYLPHTLLAICEEIVGQYAHLRGSHTGENHGNPPLTVVLP